MFVRKQNAESILNYQALKILSLGSY